MTPGVHDGCRSQQEEEEEGPEDRSGVAGNAWAKGTKSNDGLSLTYRSVKTFKVMKTLLSRVVHHHFLGAVTQKPVWFRSNLLLGGVAPPAGRLW